MNAYRVTYKDPNESQMYIDMQGVNIKQVIELFDCQENNVIIKVELINEGTL